MKRHDAALRCCGLAATLALGACGTGIQSALNAAGEQAQHVLSLLQLMLWVCGLMYLAVVAFLAWSLWRVRQPLGAASQSIPDGRLNRGLVLWAGVVVTGLTVLIFASFLTDRALATGDRGNFLNVRLTAHQWWWRIEYRHPETGEWIETANELHLPAGRMTRMALGSADVIHSMWIPSVAGKMDVIPGRNNVLQLTPVRLGWFRGQCAEFCGTQHALMVLDVKVESADEFRAWLDAQARPATSDDDPVLARGRRVVTEGACAACHVVRGTAAAGRPGPDLTHFGSHRSIAAGAVAMSRGALQGWIVQPQALKPGTLMPQVTLEPVDADAAARYLESLK